MKTLLFQTKNGNIYLHSSFKREVILMNPLLLPFLFRNNKIIIDKTISKEKYDTPPKKDYALLRMKYQLLEDNGYFQEVNNRRSLTGRLDSFDIKQKVQNFPTILFEVTDDCNLQCEYCGYGDLYEGYFKRESKTLSLDWAFSCINYVEKIIENNPVRPGLNGLRIGFYGGEPLLNMPFIRKIVKYVSKKNRPDFQVTFGMTTNGTLIDRYLDFLIENNIDLAVSLDGDEYANSYRVYKNGKNSFTKVFSNLLKLKDYNPEYYKNVQLLAVIHDRTKIDEALQFFKSKLGKTPTLMSLKDIQVNPQKKAEVKKMHLDYGKYIVKKVEADHYIKDAENFERVLSGLKLTLKGFYNNLYSEYDEFFDHYYQKKQVPTATCLPFQKVLFVTRGGKILHCEKINNHHPMGHVDDDGVHLNFENVACIINGLYDKAQRACNSCYIAKSCPQCVYYMNTEGNKVRCSRKKTAGQFIKKLSEGFSRIEANRKLYHGLLQNK